jgi:uncharacterized protein (DUF1684 family)
MARVVFTVVGLLVLVSRLGCTAAAAEGRYREEIERWREKREADLKADDGWLSVSGLYWICPGQTRIGSDPANDILLPARTPGSVGAIELAEGKASFRPSASVTITRNSIPFHGGPIESDADEHPDTLAIGDVKLILLKRGDRFAVRVKDNQSPCRAEFAGLSWYPVREEWRIQAQFIAFPSATKLKMETIIGETEATESPGYATFERGGKFYRLQAAREKDGSLWFVFRDRTSGRTTHGGARQLHAAPPRGGLIELDFNKAVNLPCAYTPYATCPLAPRENRLDLAIEAGERKYEPARRDRSARESGRPSS